MATTSRDFLRPLRTPAYAFLGATLLFQFADFALSALPFTPGSPVWRFAMVGSFVNNIGNVLLLVALLYGLALYFGSRAVVIIVGLIALLCALMSLGGGAAFVLDALQLRGKVDPQNLRKFDIQAAEVLLKSVIEGIVSMLFVVSAFRGYSATTRELQRDTSNDGLFMARPEALFAKSKRGATPAVATSAVKDK
jgi:hypothetical protein